MPSLAPVLLAALLVGSAASAASHRPPAAVLAAAMVAAVLAAAAAAGVHDPPPPPPPRDPLYRLRAAVITVGARPSPADQFAADTLQHHLALRLPVKTLGDRPPAAFELAVGAATAFAMGMPLEQVAGLGDDGYTIWAPRPPLLAGSFAVTAGNSSARGAMNGAFALLHRLGFRFLPALSALGVPGETVVRAPVASASLPAANLTHVPPFKSRDLDGFALVCHGSTSPGAPISTAAAGSSATTSQSRSASTDATPRPLSVLSKRRPSRPASVLPCTTCSQRQAARWCIGPPLARHLRRRIQSGSSA